MMTRNSPLLSYGVALLSVALALAISLLLSSSIQPPPLALFYMAVILSTWYGGLKPGLVATVLSTLAISYFIPPYNSLSIINLGNLVRLGAFVITALLISRLDQARRVTLRQEQQLQVEAETAHRRTAHLLEHMTDAFVAFDRHWRYTYANPAALQLLQKSPEELIGKNVWEVFPSEKGGFAYQQLHRALEGQVSVSWEEFGEPVQRWLEVRAYPSPEGVAIYFQDISERKQAEAALRQNEEQLRLATEGANLGLWHWDVSQERLVWTDQCKALFGLPADTEMSYQVFLNAVHPDDRQRIQEMRPVLEDGQLEHHEIEYRTLWSNGTVRWLMARGSTSYDADGKALFSRGVVFDITDRKQAEIAIHEAEERLKLAVEAGRMIAWEWNPFDDSLITSANFPEIYGANDIHTVEQGIALLHPEDQPPHRAIVEQAVETRSEYYCEFRIIRPDTGAIVWMEERGKPILNSDGTLQKLIGVSIDISDRRRDEDERKRIEEELRKSEQQLRSAIEVAQFSPYEWNPATSKLVWDAQLKAMWGLSPDAEVNYAVHNAGLHPEDREYVELQAAKAIDPNGDGIFEAEFRVIGIEDGVERWISARGQTFFDAERRPVYYVGAAQNISDRKRAEAEREQLLAREQAARKSAETANRIKDEFLAVLSHELRSPLNPILGWSRLLQNGKLDESKTKQALATIERNAKLQSELIEDLLDVSRILQGKLSLTVSPINLKSTIQAAIETVRLAAEAKSIAIETRLDSEIGLVSGDSTRLQQIVLNLLSNAVKFTPTGGQVTVQLEQANDYVQITVRDTGKGIAADFLPHVFDYFRQADSTTTRKFGGLGLGLAIVRHLVELHGGTIQADSPGESLGATFTVKLPMMANEITASHASPLSQQPLNLQGVQILVVDDETDTRDLIAFLLEQAGATVTTAASAREALTLFIRSQPDLLVSDVGMPEMNGYMLMQQIRTFPPDQGGQVKAIALTAYAGDFDQQQALQAGFQRHLAKPIEPQELIQTISALCNSAETWQKPNFQGAMG